MKLFAYLPKSYGDVAFFVCALNREDADAAVRRECAKPGEEGDDLRRHDLPEMLFYENHYTIEEHEPGVTVLCSTG